MRIVRALACLEGFIIKRKTIKCPYCGAQATIRPSSVVHGTGARSEHLFVCSRFPKCDSYVGVHVKTLKPLGSLANKELRAKRIQTHRLFNRLWESGMMEKWQAYKWMQAKMAIPSRLAHIAMFSVYQCDELMRACEQLFANNCRAA